MKLIKRVGSILLALVLIASSFGTFEAEAAAAKPKINVQSKTIFVDGSSVRPAYGSTYIYHIKNRPKKYSVTWSSEDESIAKVEKLAYSKAQVTAVAAGTTTITADFIDKVTSTKYTLTTKIIVKKNAAALAVTPATIPELDKGDTTQLTATMYNKDASVCEKGEVTDTVKWMSDNEKVATVSSTGLVTAVGPGKASITAYSVQTTSGTYSKLSKATAKKTVEISVKDPDVVGIVEVKQTALNKIEVKFGGDYSGNVSTDNLTVSKNGFATLVKNIEFDSTKTVATLTMYSELENGGTYIVKYNNSLVTVGKETQFVASKGYPARFELYTDIEGNKVIAGANTPIRFRIFDSNNVDITPLDPLSQEYATASARLTLKAVDNTNTYGSWYVDSPSKYVYILDAGKTVAITAEYKYTVTDNNTFEEKTLNGVISLSSVSEASTLQFDRAAIVPVSKTGSTLDWTKTSTKLSLSDISGYKLVVRLKGPDGKYIYTDDTNSRFIFSSETSKSCFVKNDGSIIPFEVGSDSVILYFGDDIKTATPVAPINIEIIGKRVATSMVFEQNKQRVSTIRMSGSYGVSKETLNVSVLDQFGEVINISDAGFNSFAGNLSASCVASNFYGPSAICYSNGDGTGKVVVDALGYGGTTSSGTSYQMKVTFDDPLYGKYDGYFTVLVVMPDSAATSTYKVEVSGDTNMKIDKSGSELPKLSVELYEMKNGIKYNKISPVKSSPNSYASTISDGDYFYRLYKGSTEITKGVSHDEIDLVYGTDGKLTKFEPGTYSLRVYKRNGQNDLFIASTDIVLTDTSGAVKWEPVSATTTLNLRDTMTDEEIKAVFGECFKVYIGNETVGTNQITLEDTIKNNGQIFFRTAVIIENITIGSNNYTLSHRITLNTTIRSR